MTLSNLADLVGFFDLMHDAVILVDRNHHVALYNQGAEELFGHAAKDVIGQDLVMLLPPQARKAHPAHLNKFAKSTDERRMMGERSEIQGLRKDGTVFPAEASLSKVSLGTEEWFLAVVRDMSLQQEINRQALESSREKAKFFVTLNTAIGALPASIAILNRGGDIVFASKGWDSIAFDYSSGKISSAVGMNMFEFCDLITPGDYKEAALLAAGVRRVLDGSDPVFELESSLEIKKQMRHFYTTVTPLPTADGGAVVMSLDVTKRLEIDKEIRVRGASLDATLTPISIRALDSKLTFANRAFLDLWRFKDLSEAIDKPSEDFWGEGYNQQDDIDRLMDAGSWSGHRVTKPADGSPGRYVYVSLSLIRDKDGAPLCYVGSFLDLTDRLKAEEELRQSQKLQSIGTLAGGIAHDINNLLVPIMGLTELVRDDLGDDENIRNLDDVLKASDRARQLVGQILAFSRKDSPNRERISLAPIVEETTDLLRATLSRTIKISRNIQATPPVDADETQIQQIVMNLCSNAAHAMGMKGGELDVSLTSCTPDAGFFDKHKSLAHGEYVKFSVRDTGCGMSEQTLSRIFEPFFTTKEVGEGTGMGLSVVHGIVSVHQGALEVESVLGQGTLFEVYLPAAHLRPLEVSA